MGYTFSLFLSLGFVCPYCHFPSWVSYKKDKFIEPVEPVKQAKEKSYILYSLNILESYYTKK
jgi:hypothetical protein